MSERHPRHIPDVPKSKEPLRLGREIVVFMGPEGAGKSTIAKKIENETGKPRVTIGDILRGIAKNPDAKYHEECQSIIEESRYLEPNLLKDILTDRFKRNDLANGFLLDGGFRTLEEAQEFPSLLENTGRQMPVKAMYLHIPTPMSMERLVTGPNARRREGETIEGVTKRLDNHYNNLYQRMQVIEQQPGWKIHYIDATGTIGQTADKVRQTLRRDEL